MNKLLTKEEYYLHLSEMKQLFIEKVFLYNNEYTCSNKHAPKN